jgi:NADH:ubiquinone oxidoreductase subunit K
MTAAYAHLFDLCCVFIVLLFICGVYSILASFNLIRALIGIEILIKAVTLLLTVAGYVAGNTGLAQALIIILIIIEVVIMVIAGGIVFSVFKHNQTIHREKLCSLKG